MRQLRTPHSRRLIYAEQSLWPYLSGCPPRCSSSFASSPCSPYPSAGASKAIESELASRRLVFVAGGSTAGRTPVAAAVALALVRRGGTLLVDANDPAHGMGDTLQTDLLSTEPLPLNIPGSPPSLITARLSCLETRAFMENLLATDKWRRLIEDDAGSRMAAAVGIPVTDLLSVLDCVRPPPGAEMPVALARLLRRPAAMSASHVVVDAGAATLATQLQVVPPAVADALEGITRFQTLIRKAREAAMPAAMASGLRFLVGKNVRESATAQFVATMELIQELQIAMKALASAEKTTLLVLPYSPGRAGVKSACRLVERLQPTCVALTHYRSGPANLAPRPEWLPPGPSVVTLPWGDELPLGLAQLSTLADAMCA